MTKEETEKRIKVMQAFVDGKDVEVLNTDKWELVSNPSWSPATKYRIKQEPKYRPFKDVDECWEEMQKHQPFGWVTFFNNTDMRYRAFVYTVYNGVVDVCGKPFCTLESAFINFTFEDGTPFGKLEE